MFYEFAAKQIAIYRNMGYRGAYLGGAYDNPAIEKIMEIERSFAPDDWRQFYREINFSRPDEFIYYSAESNPGPSEGGRAASRPAVRMHRHTDVRYRISKWTHGLVFTRGILLGKLGATVCGKSKDPEQCPRAPRTIEHPSKAVLFRCKDCGDCSLPDIAFLCPESQCAKNQRNGPCGGTLDGRCEVEGYGDCIWLRAYDRLRADGIEPGLMLNHAPVVQNQALRGTSSWANFWLGRDHSRFSSK